MSAPYLDADVAPWPDEAELAGEVELRERIEFDAMMRGVSLRCPYATRQLIQRRIAALPAYRTGTP
jgi:hypothetical protein